MTQPSIEPSIAPAPPLDASVAHHLEAIVQTLSYAGNSRDAVFSSIERCVENERTRRIIHDALHAGPDHD